ncbi:hypothetical protein NMY22_g6209 [Coprinellus aureogranulatus]|nr:hypothetical protein NMY22_g6209 [Coprinellus aureogranulatus]
MFYSRDLFPFVRDLEPKEFQSILNYTSSRCRAAANAFILHGRDSPDSISVLFILALTRELSTANALLGLGIMLYSHQQIRPPYFVRNATPLMVQNRLTDWDALNLAVRNGRDSGDDLLSRYDQAWWVTFQEGVDIESFKQAPVDIVRCWKNQRKNLPAPIPMPPVGLVQLNALADDELERAWSIGCDGIKILDAEISDNERFIADVTVMLVRCSAAMRDLKAAEERAMDEAEAEVNA